MGLDMYAYSLAADTIPADVEIDFERPEGAERTELAYWRKHSDLHGWMQSLYRAKGGTDTFNCVPVRLREADLAKLKVDLVGRTLPETTGFFFGQSSLDTEEIAEDLAFVDKALAELAEGRVVYYTSWW